MSDTPSRNHTMADHRFGLDAVHTHDGLSDHDHDDFDGSPGEDGLWLQDHVTLTSVGIDIGSSGTQVLFSRIELRRRGEDLSSRYYVVGRETLYESPIALTPYANEERIAEADLGSIIDAAYTAAGVRPEDIDTGVVILTGEALRRENAETIAAILAARGGDFVTATAGHHMEAMLAAYGSGAAQISSDRQTRVLNIDIGGGTTKLALLENGKIIRTAALHIGGRLQVVDAEGRITRLDPAGRHHAHRAGFQWAVGGSAAPEEMGRVAEGMAEALVTALTADPLPQAVADLYLTDAIGDLAGVSGIIVSGGVGEYVYGHEARDFGDMGRRLGTALRRRIDAGALPWPLLPAGACIRATALGASEYSVQLSGNTGHFSDLSVLLPRRNLRVLQPAAPAAAEIVPAALAQAIRTHCAVFDIDPVRDDFALALQWSGEPAYPRLRAFAAGIVEGLSARIKAKAPLYLMLDGDIAQTLGAMLRDEFGVTGPLMVIDGVMLWDFDYVDLGRIRLPSRTVPVTIKSLVFSDDPRGRRRERLHHHPHHHDHGDHLHEHHHDHGHAHDHEHHHHPHECSANSEVLSQR